MQGTSDPLNQAEISSEEKEFSFKELLEAIDSEEFERAARLRDRINNIDE